MVSRLKIKKSKLREIILVAIKKVGSERKLCNALKLSKGSLYRYKNELSYISNNKLSLILGFIDLNIETYKVYIEKFLPYNWAQIKGGLKCVENSKISGKFESSLLALKTSSSNYMKSWHKNMRENFPNEYYNLQYSRFKKNKWKL